MIDHAGPRGQSRVAVPDRSDDNVESFCRQGNSICWDWRWLIRILVGVDRCFCVTYMGGLILVSSALSEVFPPEGGWSSGGMMANTSDRASKGVLVEDALSPLLVRESSVVVRHVEVGRGDVQRRRGW